MQSLSKRVRHKGDELRSKGVTSRRSGCRVTLRPVSPRGLQSKIPGIRCCRCPPDDVEVRSAVVVYAGAWTPSIVLSRVVVRGMGGCLHFLPRLPDAVILVVLIRSPMYFCRNLLWLSSLSCSSLTASIRLTIVSSESCSALACLSPSLVHWCFQ